MKKRRSFFPRRRKSSGRYGLEAAILCVLLMVAAYVSNAEWSPERADYARQSGKNRVADAQRAIFNSIKNIRASSAGKSAPVADEREYRLVRASDGDSFVLKDGNGRTIRVRLYGIDAPESRQPYGKQSKAHLLSLIQNRPLRLKTMYLDNYKRTVSLVYLADQKRHRRAVRQSAAGAGGAWHGVRLLLHERHLQNLEARRGHGPQGTPRPLAGQRSHAAMAVASRAEKEEKVS